jgi:hypothetical protein
MQKKFKVTILACLCIIIVGATIYLSASRIEYSRIQEIPGKIVQISKDDNYNAFPKAIRTNDFSTNSNGSILTIWYSGNGHVDSNSNGTIQASISQTDGDTWSIPFIIYDDPIYDCRNYGFLKAPNGTLVIFFSKVEVTATKNIWVDFGFIKSYNHGVDWSEFVSLQSIIPAKNGNGYGDAITIGAELYILCYGEALSGASASQTTFLLVSSNNGETWSAKSNLNADTTIATNEADFWFCESIQQIIGFTRVAEKDKSKEVLYYFNSSDFGATWTLRPTNVWGHCPDIFGLPDGKIMVTFRARTFFENYYLGYFTFDSCFIDTDNLQNLQEKVLFKPPFMEIRGDIAYPSAITRGDTELLVIYYSIASGGVFGKIVELKNL